MTGIIETRRILLCSPGPQVRVIRWVDNRLNIFLVIWTRQLGSWAGLKGDMCASIWDWTKIKVRWFEYHPLIVAFALTFAFDAVLADWTFFVALDTTFTTSQASSLGPFARQFGLQRRLCSRYIRICRIAIIAMAHLSRFRLSRHATVQLLGPNRKSGFIRAGASLFASRS